MTKRTTLSSLSYCYDLGDEVRLVTRNIRGKREALGKPYEGPFEVTGINYPNVTIALDDEEKTFHANLFPMINFRIVPPPSNSKVPSTMT